MFVSRAFDELMTLVCGVVADISEADLIGSILTNASDKLGVAMRHAVSAMEEIDDTLTYSVTAINNFQPDDWHRISQHIQTFRDHTRHVHELWPQNLAYLKQELLPSLSPHFYSPGGTLPQIGFWIARITRTDHLPTIRSDVWGQISTLIADICTALDPVPLLLDKLEAYTVDQAARVEVLIMSSSARPNSAILKNLGLALAEMLCAWSKLWRAAHGATFGVEVIVKQPRVLSRPVQLWQVSSVLLFSLIIFVLISCMKPGRSRLG